MNRFANSFEIKSLLIQIFLNIVISEGRFLPFLNPGTMTRNPVFDL